MKELSEYRAGLINRLVETAREFRAVCLSATDVHTRSEPGGWSIHQVAAHTRDVDKWAYGLRARRTAVEDQPEFQNFDGDAYMAEHYSPAEPLEAILDELVARAEELVELLRGFPSEAWSRESRHAMLGGGLTLQSWVEKDLGHIKEHLEEIKLRTQPS